MFSFNALLFHFKIFLEIPKYSEGFQNIPEHLERKNSWVEPKPIITWQAWQPELFFFFFFLQGLFGNSGRKATKVFYKIPEIKILKISCTLSSISPMNIQHFHNKSNLYKTEPVGFYKNVHWIQHNSWRGLKWRENGSFILNKIKRCFIRFRAVIHLIQLHAWQVYWSFPLLWRFTSSGRIEC